MQRGQEGAHRRWTCSSWEVSPFRPERAGGLESIDPTRRDSERPRAADHPSKFAAQVARRTHSQALTAPAPRRAAAPVPRPPELLDSSLAAPGRRRARLCSAPRLPLAPPLLPGTGAPRPAALGAPARHRSSPSPSAPRAPPPARLVSDGSDTCSPSPEPPARAAAPPGAPARAPHPPPPRSAVPPARHYPAAHGGKKGGKGKEAEGGNFLAPDGKSAAHSANTTG